MVTFDLKTPPKQVYPCGYGRIKSHIHANGSGKVNVRFGMTFKFSGLNKPQLCMTKGQT